MEGSEYTDRVRVMNELEVYRSKEKGTQVLKEESDKKDWMNEGHVVVVKLDPVV